MLQRQLTGGRIRARRLDLGVRQVDLAARAGISPSYLNLIEHDRRSIAGKLLNDLARVLDVDPAGLVGGVADVLLADLAAAAAQTPSEAEGDRIEEFASRFPGWAGLIIAQATEVAALRARVRALGDRLTHDPGLAAALHAVISAVTSIRATAGILVGADLVDADWQRRFHHNIHGDAQRLTDSSQALIQYLEAPGDAAVAPLDPLDAALRALGAAGWHLPLLEKGTTVAVQLAAMGDPGGTFGQVLSELLADYRSDALAMPLGRLLAAGARLCWEPAALAADLGVGLAAMLRRLATLPTGPGLPVCGLVVIDGAGALRFQRPVAGVALPNTGACPLWPVFQALVAPLLPMRRDVVMPGGQRFRVFAVTETCGPASFDASPLIRATMLLVADPDLGTETAPPLPVGPGCRVCPRADCTARREPSILSGASPTASAAFTFP